MANFDSEIKLIRARICISCGVNTSRINITQDHMYPQCLIGTRSFRRSEARNSPFFPVVYQVANIFPLCRDEHTLIDGFKIAIFLGINPCDNYETKMRKVNGDARGYPEELIAYLRDNYPITRSPRLFESQRRMMTRTNGLFEVVAATLNGDMDEGLKDRYLKAALVAQEFNRKLKCMPVPGTVIDFGQSQGYNGAY